MQTSNNKENDGTQRHKAVGRNDGGGISADGAGAIQKIGDFGDIRSFAEGLSDEHWGDREVSERELREIISYYAITDVGADSDNVLLGEDDEMYFIDPLIKLKKNAKEVIFRLIDQKE